MCKRARVPRGAWSDIVPCRQYSVHWTQEVGAILPAEWKSSSPGRVEGVIPMEDFRSQPAKGCALDIPLTREAREGQNLGPYSSPMGRREAVKLLGIGAGLGFLSAAGPAARLLAAPWQAAVSGTGKVTFPRGAVIRTILKD